MTEREPKVPEGQQVFFTPEYIAEKKAERHVRRRYTTVVFNDEAEWARFLEHVYDEYGGPVGLAFTDSPLPMSVRVSPELLESTYQRFPMCQVTREEEQSYLAGLKGDRPFHPETFKGRRVPAVEHFRRSRGQENK